ncbi:hypothetical protein LY76DRAFT_15536 [Colletotrichum caudatum]|nr:hypothetical protein LY76DRAFT_15536 [Colletotrichum caudatum]
MQSSIISVINKPTSYVGYTQMLLTISSELDGQSYQARQERRRQRPIGPDQARPRSPVVSKEDKMDWEPTKVAKAQSSRRQKDQEQHQKRKEFKCYGYGKKGHLKRDCPKEQKHLKANKSEPKDYTSVRKSKPSLKDDTNLSSKEWSEARSDQTSDKSGKE